MDKQKGRGRFVFLCLAPAVILFTVFMVIPTINVFRMSLYKWGGYSANQEFVGLDNFKKLFADPKFYQSFQNTILLIVIVTIITFAFALVFAAILSREKIKGQNFFRVIFYIPNILSVVVISAIFSAIYDPNNGMLNSLIALFREPGEVPTLWLGNQQLVIYSIAIALVIALTNRNDRLMVLMMKNVSVVRMFVHTSGIVMEKNVLTRPAPSRLTLS